MTVDGTDYRIPEQTPFWSGWWSYKFNGPGLRYEVGLNIQNGWICWVHGPFAPGKWNDITIYRSLLKRRLALGERVEADAGYAGDFTISVPDDATTFSQIFMKNDARARHETVNKRLKQFKVLKEFRHEIDFHQSCFDAVAVITQLGIENGEPLYPVTYII